MSRIRWPVSSLGFLLLRSAPTDFERGKKVLKNLRPAAKVCLIAVALCALFPGSIAFGQKRRPGDPISPDYRIYSLQVDGMSMIGALLSVGRQLHIPMGIRYLDRDAVQKPVSVRLPRVRRQKGKIPPHSLAPTIPGAASQPVSLVPPFYVGPTLATALNAILAVGVDYAWQIRGVVIVWPMGEGYAGTKPFGSPIQIDNRRAQWPDKNLLYFRLAKFKIPKCTLEEASHRLEVALSAALHPGAQAVMGDHYPGTGKNLVGPLTFRRHTVADILDELVAKEKTAAWVVQVPPEVVDRLPPEGLWRIIDYDDPAFDQAIEAVKKNILRYPETDSPEN